MALPQNPMRRAILLRLREKMR